MATKQCNTINITMKFHRHLMIKVFAAPNAPLLKINSESILFSTANKVDDGIEIRVYNMSEWNSSATILLPKNVSKAQVINLDGKIERSLEIKNNKLYIELDKWKIETIQLIYIG